MMFLLLLNFSRFKICFLLHFLLWFITRIDRVWFFISAKYKKNSFLIKKARAVCNITEINLMVRDSSFNSLCFSFFLGICKPI